MKYWIYIVLGMLYVHPILAQDEPPTGGEIEDAQIIIEKDKDLTLPPASRIYKRTRVKSVTAEIQDLDFQITQPSYDFQPHIPGVKLLDFQASADQEPYGIDNFVRLGYGNYNALLAQGYLGYSQEKKQVGLWVNHQSFGKGPVRDNESSYGYTGVMLTGGLQGDAYSFDPAISYRREGYFPYGYDPENTAVDFDYEELKIGASTFSAELPVSFTPTEPLSFSLKPAYQVTQMKFQDQDPFNREHQLQLDGDFHYDLNESWEIEMDASVQYIDYAGGLEQNRTLFKAHPKVSFNGGQLSGDLGLRYVAASGNPGSSSHHLFLDISAYYQLDDHIRLFATLEGDLEPVTLESIQLQNRYLDDSLQFLNQEIPVRFKGGVELGLMDRLMLKPYVAFQQTRNKGLLFHSPTDTSRFLILYDIGNFNQFSIGMESRFVVSPKTTFMSGIDYTAYNPSGVAEPWYLPKFTFNTIGYQQVGEALTLNLNLTVLAGIVAPQPIDSRPITLDPIVDLGLGATYDFTKKFSAFIDLDNLLGINYERYLNYPVRGFMARGGLSYRF